MEKDRTDLLWLNKLIENQIDITNPYFIRLYNISKDNNSAQTQYDLNMAAAKYNDDVEAVLNDLYNDIRKNIPPKDFEKLKQSEIRWLRHV